MSTRYEIINAVGAKPSPDEIISMHKAKKASSINDHYKKWTVSIVLRKQSSFPITDVKLKTKFLWFWITRHTISLFSDDYNNVNEVNAKTIYKLGLSKLEPWCQIRNAGKGFSI